MKANKCLSAISLITGMILVYAGCIDAPFDMADARGSTYAGSSSCTSCHAGVAGNYLHDAHKNSSWPGTDVATRLQADSGRYEFDVHQVVAIEKRDSGLYQVGYNKGRDSIAKRFDMGFGSGRHAFSFGYWQNKVLYQLPLSWLNDSSEWVNSPGFPAHRANFQRPIIQRCFECHSSFVAEDPLQAQSLEQLRQLDQSSVIYGIDCERCHGAAAEHVNFHLANPAVKEARYIAGWSSLSRQQKIDACAVCHSGNDLQTQRSTFAFKPGDTLSAYYYPEYAATSNASPDVHGKQAQLLAASRCYRESKVLECGSCHNIHAPGKPGPSGYVSQCLSCHKNAEHKTVAPDKIAADDLISNCINCHMPKKASALISFRLAGKDQANQYLLNTHRIAVYPEVTEQVIGQIKQQINEGHK